MSHTNRCIIAHSMHISCSYHDRLTKQTKILSFRVQLTAQQVTFKRSLKLHF